ncbi:2Fe-2S iron-sulfur cluster-binding protein [Variovorax sp. J31P207]|uniref:2Fe-2S iron-sulfur cluster-binding protein n=1 Tax=Variovorax sp. J31P207 TaxID=3053510 RepID=UPI0025755A35|nr:2Fe-2S iron-sulfur cluster-binding protein [Variovorax sp. J31P207]MDM0072687.1 2Fe-2S iron-sulfur cluster-binding protein [Variovorax sp. J31P207]
MTRVIFVQSDGATQEVDAIDGQSAMQAAIGGLVPGIFAECGGELSCATCHVFVHDEWLNKLPERSQQETDMLEVTSEEPTDASRLCCQIRIDSSLDGLTVLVPKTQK